MANFWKHVNQVINSSDILIEVLDARMVEETRNEEIERKILRSGKKLLFVLNKTDLIDVESAKIIQKHLQPSIFVSSREKLGTTILKKKILEISHGEPCLVGILGYPNVGKSSLINALAGRAAARTSKESGFTKGMQRVKVDNKITLLDTPGVFPNKEKNESKHGRTGAVDYGKVKDPEGAALNLIEQNKGLICEQYQVKGADSEEILNEIAKKRKMLIKGGLPNIEATARMILKEWQTGKHS